MYEKLNKYDDTLESLNSIKNKLKDLEKTLSQKTVFLGFDGYVDSLYSLARVRESRENWQKMDSMKEFGERVIQVAGSSGNVERVLKRKISGGFAPNTCKGINGLGVNVRLMAAIGYPNIDENFQSIADRESVKAIPIANPGETVGLEFHDGKIMLTDFDNIYKINWDILVERVGIEKIIESLQASDTMGFGHWSLLFGMDNIWEHLIEDIFPSINNLKDKLFFVDLADVKKQKKDAIIDMLKLLRKIDEHIPVMLSLNDQEASDISKVLDNVKDIDTHKDNFEDYLEGGKLLNENIGISNLIIHSPHFATISTKNKHYWVTEAYTSEPRYTTGAGDHFHSGAAAGLTCGLTPPEAILMGNALTAVFVRTGNSPNFKDLSNFINRYLEYIDVDNPEFP